MIFYDCPYCGELNATPLARDHRGAFERRRCSDGMETTAGEKTGCGRYHYVRHSEIDGCILTEEEWPAFKRALDRRRRKRAFQERYRRSKRGLRGRMERGWIAYIIGQINADIRQAMYKVLHDMVVEGRGDIPPAKGIINGA